MLRTVVVCACLAVSALAPAGPCNGAPRDALTRRFANPGAAEPVQARIGEPQPRELPSPTRLTQSAAPTPPALPDGKVRPPTDSAIFDEYFRDFIGPPRGSAPVRQQTFVPPGSAYASGTASGPRAPRLGWGWLGVLLQHKILDPPSERYEVGALLALVQANSPAARAGLREHDLIVRFDGKEVKEPHSLHDLIRSAEANQVDIVFIRDGTMLTTSAVLGRLRDQRAVPNAEVGGQGQSGAGGKSRR